MADAFLEIHGARTRGIVVAEGGHPLPNTASFAAGEAALRLADENRARGETLVVLLSGGASAMMAAPAPGVTLADKIAKTRELLASGRPIAEINAVRKQMSAIKGGKLAARAGGCITFALSDVHAPIEDDPSVIGSGPGVGSLSSVLGDSTEERHPAQFVLVGSRRNAMIGAREAANRLGYIVHVIDAPILGEARDAARRLASAILAAEILAPDVSPSTSAASAFKRKICVISSGETTVTLPHGLTGKGGRNQELALAFAMNVTGGPYAFASIGTDGIDGPTDAAGALVDERTLERAKEKSLDAAAALQAHDTYPFFAALGDHVVTGSTGTNVGDVQVFLTSGSLPSLRP
jgi:glycerate 2-kinase